jgi:hypothetical protein
VLFPHSPSSARTEGRIRLLALDKQEDAGRSRLSTQEFPDLFLLSVNLPKRQEHNPESEPGIYEMHFIPDSPMQLSRFVAELSRVQHSPYDPEQICVQANKFSREKAGVVQQITGLMPVN